MSFPMLGSPEFRAKFPALTQTHNDHHLVYFDNAATTLKPQEMVDAVSHFYLYDSANVHRGSHFLSDRATSLFEQGREDVRSLLNASEASEIIFNRGTTDGVNLVAQKFVAPLLRRGDEILLTEIEHHSNLVPWQMIAEQCGAHLKFIPVRDDGALDLTKLDSLLTAKTRFVALTAVSNTLGTINPVQEIIRRAHLAQARVLVDAAQAIAHEKIDVRIWDCDFLVFSAHKVYGPTGLGVLYGKASLLKTMDPLSGGGGMIKEATYEKTTYGEAPFRFEAGTPHIEGVVGLSAAIRFLNWMGLDRVFTYEHELTQYATHKLKQVPGLLIYGEAKEKGPIISFLIEGIHPSDLGMVLNQYGIAVRVGHHCTEPLMRKWKIAGTVRASFAPYNTKEEVDRLIEALLAARKLFLA